MMKIKKKLFTTLLIFFLVLSIFPFSFVPKVSASPGTWFDGFEMGNFNLWDSVDAPYWTINSDVVRSGSYSAKCVDPPPATYAQLIKTFSDVGLVSTINFYVYFETLDFALREELTYFFAAFYDTPATTRHLGRIRVIRLDNYPPPGIELELYGYTWNGVSNQWGIGPGYSPVVLNEWRHYTMYIDSTPGAVDVKLYVEGELVIDGPSVGDTFRYAMDGFCFNGYTPDNEDVVMYIDDVSFTNDLIKDVWHEDVTISNMEGCGNWVIAEEDFYSFESQYGHLNASGDAATYIDTAKIAFYDGFHWMNSTYDAQTEIFSVESGIEIFALKAGGITESGLYLNVTFEIYFYGEVLDALNVDIYMYVNDTAGNEDTWEIQAEDYFNIYHLGGYPAWTTSGYGGRTTGGEAFELWAGEIGYTNFFYCRFQDVALPGWGTFQPNATLGMNYVESSDEQAVQIQYPGYVGGAFEGYANDRSMKIYDKSDNFTSAWHQFTLQTEAANDIFYVQVYVYAFTQTEDLSIIITNGSEGGTGGPYIRFMSDGYAYFVNATDAYKIKEAKYSAAWWRNMTFAINMTSQTYDIWWNDVEEQSDVAFYANRTNLDVLILTTYVGTIPATEESKIYIDEVRIWRDAIPGSYTGSSQVTVAFRKLQHIHALFAFGIPYATEALVQSEGFIEWGIDYCINDTWINNAWKIRLSLAGDSEVQDVTLGTSGNNWIRLKAEWYERNTTLIDTEYFYTFWEGGPGGLSAAGQKVDYFRVYLDLWFNRINASTTVGGRVSSYYYGMSDRSDPWWHVLTGTDWKIIGGERAQSMYFADLEDNSGAIHSAKEIEMMRIRAKVYRSANYDYLYRMEEFDLLSYKIAPDIMSGIDTPIFTETKIPAMPAGGFLAALSSAFSALIKTLADALGPGLLAFWDVLVDFLDTIFTWAGWPNGFSQIVGWISSFFTFMINSASTLLTILTSIFEIVTGPLVDFLALTAGLITNTISSLTGMVTQITNAYNDTVLPLTPMIVPIITLIGVMLPMWELIRMEQKGFAILFQDLNMIFDLFAFFINLFLNIVNFVVGLISKLINAIPVIE